MRSNCLIFALRRWFRDGGHVLVVPSDNWPGPHFRFTLDGVVYEEFYPRRAIRRLLPPLVFQGAVRHWEPRASTRRPGWVFVAVTVIGAWLVLPPLMIWAFVTREWTEAE